MSYNTIENSADSGSVIELYEFIQGLSKYRYASCENEVVYQSARYKPFSGSRQSVKQTADIFKDSIAFTFPKSDDFASQYLAFAPDEPITVTIYRGHSTDSAGEYSVYWKGRVVGVKTEGNAVTIDCESLFTSMKRPGLRAKFEYGCRHSLYLQGCNVNREAFKFRSPVLGVSGTSVSIQGASVLGNGFLTGGMLVMDSGISRFITKHIGDNITISRTLPSLVGGSVVSVYPGCDHTMTTCKNKFANLDNFGGFPWIPTTNPFAGSSII